MFDSDFGYDAVFPMPITFKKPDRIDINIENVLGAFQFKYVPKEEFGRIIKQVRRNKKKEQEEIEWMKFLASQQQKYFETCPEGSRQETNISMLHLNEAQSLEQIKYQKGMGQQYVTKQENNNGQHLVPVDIQEEQVWEKQKRQIVFPLEQHDVTKEQEDFEQQLIDVQDQIPVTGKQRRVVFPQQKHGVKQKMVDIQEDQILQFENLSREILQPQQDFLSNRQENFRQQLEEDIQDNQIVESEKQRRQIIFQKLSKTLKRDLQKTSQTWISGNEANTSTCKNQNSMLSRKSSPSQKHQNEFGHCACINQQSEPNIKSPSRICKGVTVQLASISQQSTSRRLSPNQICQNDTVQYACASEQSCRKSSPNHLCQYETAQSGCITQRSTTDRNSRSSSHDRISKDEQISSSYPSHHSIPQDTECAYNKNICIVPKLNLCGSQRESVHSRRVRSIKQKIDSVCNEILQQVEHIPAPDGSQDLLRRRKRASEFSARFARNYLYHLRHQVCELQKQIKVSASTHRGRHTLHQSMCQKLVSGHQMALQGLQAYLRHMPSSIRGAAGEKLKELFESLTELTALSSQMGVESECDVDSIERKSQAVLEHISGLVHHRDTHDLNSSDSQEETINMMTTTGQREWESSLREPSKILLTSQPSPMDNKTTRWQDMATKLARAAYGSPCKKKHLGLCKNQKQIPGSKVIKKDEESSPKKSGSALKMPSQSELHPPYFSDRLLHICEKMMLELVNSIKTQEHDSDLVSKSSREDMQATIQQIQDITSCTLDKVTSENSLGAKHKKSVFRKNVQLICLHQESDDEKTENNEIVTANNEKNSAEVSHINSKPESDLHQEASSVELHSNKLLSTILTVSKKVLRSAMDCRQRFQNHHKGNPMYKRVMHPWEMVERLADHLMVQLLQQMAQETSLDTLINDLYNAEFGGKCLVSHFDKT